MPAQLPPLNQYQQRLYNRSLDQKRVICKTCKAASSFIRNHTREWPRLTPEEAVKHSKNGERTILFVRDPIDRFVSGFEYFRQGSVLGGFVRDDTDRKKITSKTTPIEEWFELIQKWPNEHWERQIELHTSEGYFIPNEIYPTEALRLYRTNPVNVSPGRQETEWYFKDKPEFRAILDEYFAKDLELYHRALEEWNGQAPSVF